MARAEEAFLQYSKKTNKERAEFLREIGRQILEIETVLVEVANRETHLPEARLKGELQRTVSQLNSFADFISAGDYVNATIDRALPDRKPAPRPDLRKMLTPVGPVVVFGASNFPLAFSTAGGDTASALAAGCSVVVKSHPAHAETSGQVASAIKRAIEVCDMPEDVFIHIEDGSIEAGQKLVSNSKTKSVAFTGSFQGGKALFDLANARRIPIPVFAEMGSINPVILFPESIQLNSTLAETLANSIVLGVGQFCTNPGLIITLDSPGLGKFLADLAMRISSAQPGKMLHTGIAANFSKNKTTSLAQPGVTPVSNTHNVDENGMGVPALGIVNAADFISNPTLHEEVFGPYSLIVTCDRVEDIRTIAKTLHGQLTTSFFGTTDELKQHADIISEYQQISGRILINGVPTGVEVCKAMHHGGPFPSTTDSRFTSVGNDAIERFVRPVCFQNFPDDLLPSALKNENKTGILRCIDNVWTRDSIVSGIK